MLTPLLNDNDDIIGPTDTIRKNKYTYNNNISDENNINNNKNFNARKNIFQKKKKLNLNNIGDNFQNDNNNNINNYFNNKSEPNYQPQNSINKNYQSNLKENNNQNIYNNNQENIKYSKKLKNTSKYSNKNSINNNINNDYNINNKFEYNKKDNKSINYNKINEKNNNNYNQSSPINNNKINSEFPQLNYEIRDYKAENLSKNQYYIKYVTLNRQGCEYIQNRDFQSALIIFQNCFDLSKNYLKDDLKQINSLINISICQYYNGNFSESYTAINKAKILYDSLNIQNINISNNQKTQLALKLFINSSLANLSMNNCNESKNDIIYLISIIRKENDIEKQFLYFKNIAYTLFKMYSLVNHNSNEINYNKEDENIEQNTIINNLMKGFIHCLKENDVGVLFDLFKDAASKYEKLNDGNGYYFSLFYHYLILYDLKKNDLNGNEKEEIKKKISLYNNKLLGNEMMNQTKEKDVNKLLNEFNEKISCACDIFQNLENFEKELNNKLDIFNKEKSNYLSEDENNLSYSHLLDKSHLVSNEKINSPIFVKLLLRFSLNFLENQKKIISENNDELENQDNMIDNYNKLINEVEIMNQKIESKEINIDNIQLHQLDKEMINSLKQLFDNLIYIKHKVILRQAFKKYLSKVRKKKNNKIIKKIVNFLSEHREKLIDGLTLIKINFKSNGFKTHFYDIDETKLTFNIRKSDTGGSVTASYNFESDIIKIQYGIKSRNLRKKLLAKEKDLDMLRLFRCPWRFISIITKDRSLDFYCDDEQIDNMFYGMKSILIDNKMAHKINSSNYYLLNKTKMKIVIELKMKYQKEEKENIPKIISDLLRERAIQNISFVKLFLIYNRYINN